MAIDWLNGMELTYNTLLGCEINRVTLSIVERGVKTGARLFD
jgi:hypothetical protein